MLLVPLSVTGEMNPGQHASHRSTGKFNGGDLQGHNPGQESIYKKTPWQATGFSNFVVGGPEQKGRPRSISPNPPSNPITCHNNTKKAHPWPPSRCQMQGAKE